MPTLDQFVDQQLIAQADQQGLIVEPLDGPANVDSVMDRFPETVYQQGRDSHLYRFLSALCGDAGAALLKKQAFIARLRSEAEIINFSDLDAFYTSHFRFARLSDETYTENPNTDSLTSDQWDELQMKDQSYRARMLDFFNATRFGNSPDGMQLAARAGSGVDNDIVEHYRYIFDQYSDDPLGLVPYGHSISTAEYVIIPRAIDSEGVGDPSRTYVSTAYQVANFTPPTFNSSAKITGTLTPLAVNYTWDNSERISLIPSFERNMLEITDRLGPVGAFMSVAEEPVHYLTFDNVSVYASSERIQLSRYVEGKADVSWPDLDQAGNYFIQAGVENESGYPWGGARELPVVFHTQESIRAYDEEALLDSTYNTDAFFDPSVGVAPFYNYRSEHTGPFLQTLVSIYPFLANVPSLESFSADKAFAIQDTPLVLETGI